MSTARWLVVLATTATACAPPLAPCARFEEPFVDAEFNGDGADHALSAYSDEEVIVDADLAAGGLPPLPDDVSLFVPDAGLPVRMGIWSPSSPEDHHYSGQIEVNFNDRTLVALSPAFSFGGAIDYNVAAPADDAIACEGAEGEPARASVITVQTRLQTSTLAATEALVIDEEDVTFLFQALAAEVFDCVGTSVQGQTCARGQILQRRVVRR